MITLNSKLKDVYSTPIGNDLISKILLSTGLKEGMITNPLFGNLKLKTVAKLTKGKLGPDFFTAFINLLNGEQEIPGPSPDDIKHKWWKEAVFYQIYPRSFNDTNKDGIGDLRGIIEKLDYLKDLGIDALWLSPIYDSPNDDNGYDIRDYRKIMTEFGTMSDFDELLEGIHKRGMRLIMDLVVNHTSDEHEWFQAALKDKNSPYRDYYYIQDGKKDDIPNNWTSFFSGDAWNYYEDQGFWALHLFSKKQMDLNWECKAMRQDVIEMIKFWLSKGVDGFRMDVINLISKQPGLPNGDTTLGSMMGITGIEHYFYGPKLHEYLREIKKEAFEPFDAFSVGETPGLGMNMAKLVTGEERHELDMIFSFDHLESPGHTRFEDYKYDLNYLRSFVDNWTRNYGNNCWSAFFYNNHDNPRMISKIDQNLRNRFALGSMLATLQLTSKCTPFIYQGDEMGLVNYKFKSMDEISDVESKGMYNKLISEGKTPDEAFAIILAGTRDHARVLLPWEAGEQAIDEEMTQVYKRLIDLRKNNKTLVYGNYQMLDQSEGRFTFARYDNEKSFLIDLNLKAEECQAYKLGEGQMIFSNYESSLDGVLKPYEARIWVN